MLCLTSWRRGACGGTACLLMAVAVAWESFARVPRTVPNSNPSSFQPPFSNFCDLRATVNWEQGYCLSLFMRAWLHDNEIVSVVRTIFADVHDVFARSPFLARNRPLAPTFQ